MASIIDPTIEETGNPADALKAVQEAAAERGTTQEQKAAVVEDPRFANKTAAEMVTIYKNLEREYGRKANETGQLRQMQDQLLALKRENDLRANGATQQQVKPAEVSASDLLENPTQALDRYFEQKESAATKDLRQRLAAQEQQMAQAGFVSRHPDWQEHTNDPTFVEWTKQTPWRSNLAVQAAQENLQAADALLTEYKNYKPLLEKSANKGTALDAARSVSMERSATSGDETRTQGKIIKRADMMALRISDPDKYESPAVQNELLRAIAENRYK